jgi:hypothetical protein
MMVGYAVALKRQLIVGLTASLIAGGCAIPIIGVMPRDRAAPSGSVLDERPGFSGQSWAKALGPVPDEAERSPAFCYATLEQRGVRFERLPKRGLNGIKMPVRLLGRLGGVEVVPQGSNAPSVLDCRLSLALLAWMPTLRNAGVDRLEHLSIYRPGAHVRGGPRISGHAYALAIDAARFYMKDHRVLDVRNDWEDRDHGDAPCPRRNDETRDGRLLRGMVCDAVAHNLFQVVLTPHYDQAHGNHVHLELKPDASTAFVR